MWNANFKSSRHKSHAVQWCGDPVDPHLEALSEICTGCALEHKVDFDLLLLSPLGSWKNCWKKLSRSVYKEDQFKTTLARTPPQPESFLSSRTAPPFLHAIWLLQPGDGLSFSKGPARPAWLYDSFMGISFIHLADPNSTHAQTLLDHYHNLNDQVRRRL